MGGGAGHHLECYCREVIRIDHNKGSIVVTSYPLSSGHGPANLPLIPRVVVARWVARLFMNSGLNISDIYFTLVTVHKAFPGSALRYKSTL